MSGQEVIESILNGLCMGGTYILIGLGLTLILGIMNILQFAHGEIYMIGAFIVYWLCVLNGLNLYVSVIISMVMTAVIGPSKGSSSHTCVPPPASASSCRPWSS
jgi:branched-chain amino acid transport system permease protein